jgi:hypothetical protein
MGFVNICDIMKNVVKQSKYMGNAGICELESSGILLFLLDFSPERGYPKGQLPTGTKDTLSPYTAV